MFDESAVGTMAHYIVESYIGVYEVDPETGRPKHFQQICFEHWLDAHPKGTTLLVDTISIPLGIKHAIAAAKSSQERRRAFKFCRIDTKPLGAWSVYGQYILDANGFSDVKIITSGDHDKESIAEVVRVHPQAYGFGVGTKILAEVENVAGVIFKECQIGGQPTLKCSSKAKATLPGKLQIWRYRDKEGYYLGDMITTDDFDGGIYTGSSYPWANASSSESLLHDFWMDGSSGRVPSMHKQREFVLEQVRWFRDFYHYPVVIEPHLKIMIEEISAFMNKDENEYCDIVIPQGLKEPKEE